jgi:hypothetical protein
MTLPIPRLAGRLAVALLLVLLAAGTVLATGAARPATPAPALAEPTATASPKAETSAKPDTSPGAAKDEDAQEAKDADEAKDAQEAKDADESPSPANLQRIVDRLAAADIDTSADALAALAAKVGVGGAVRVLLFAEASGKPPADIVAMFEAGKGWGVIARELKLDLNPGIGSVMGRGNGPDTAAKAAAAAERAAAKAERSAARAAAKAARAAEHAQGRAAGSGD